MSKTPQANRMNMQAFAEVGVLLIEATPLQSLERLAHESIGLEPDLMVKWQATAELRSGSTPDTVIWLHLTAHTSLPLTCQRCMAAVQTPLQVDQWYRFVATEDIAMAEDDESEEDLLVFTPQFDLLSVLEDELLMALPLVPMHDECPVLPAFSAGVVDVPGDLPENTDVRPNPFDVLVQLKKK